MELQKLQPDLSVLFLLNANHNHFTKIQCATSDTFAFCDLTGKLLNIGYIHGSVVWRKYAKTDSLCLLL